MIITPLLITLITVLVLCAVVHATTETEFYRAHEASVKALEHRHSLDVYDEDYRLPTTAVTQRAYSAHPAYKEAYGS